MWSCLPLRGNKDHKTRIYIVWTRRQRPVPDLNIRSLKKDDLISSFSWEKQRGGPRGGCGQSSCNLGTLFKKKYKIVNIKLDIKMNIYLGWEEITKIPGYSGTGCHFSGIPFPEVAWRCFPTAPVRGPHAPSPPGQTSLQLWQLQATATLGPPRRDPPVLDTILPLYI